jgi:hypothetical protein
MINRIRASRPGSTLRLVVFCGLAAAAFSGTLACPAYADNDHGKGHGNWNKRWNESRQENWQRTHWREQHRSYRQPDLYYTAPPVVYSPPGYYQQQPGPLLNLSIPFFSH